MYLSRTARDKFTLFLPPAIGVCLCSLQTEVECSIYCFLYLTSCVEGRGSGPHTTVGSVYVRVFHLFLLLLEASRVYFDYYVNAN